MCSSEKTRKIFYCKQQEPEVMAATQKLTTAILFVVAVIGTASLLIIDKPSLFKQFKSGDIGADAEVVHIESTAFPNILREVTNFVDARNIEIRFRDEHDNIIHLFPMHKIVKAYFWNGHHLTEFLPNNFKDYDIQYNFNAQMSDKDIQCIFGFKDAINLALSSDFDVNTDLTSRLHGLEKMKNLKKLTVQITRPNNLNIQLRPFLDSSPYLETVFILLPHTMTAEERKEFTSNQEVPTGWELQFKDTFLTIVRK